MVTETPLQKPKLPKALGVILLIVAVSVLIAIPKIKEAFSGTGSDPAQGETVALSNTLSKDKFIAWADKTVEEVVFENTLEGAPSDAEDLSETGLYENKRTGRQ